MSTHQLPDGRWICKYLLDGRQKKEYFGRGPEAEKTARARDKELAASRNTEKKITDPIFSELAFEYLKARQNTMTASTYRCVEGLVENILVPYLGQKEAGKISHATIDAFVIARKKEGVKNRTVRDNINYVHTILNYAVKTGRIILNPIKGYTLPRDDSARISPPTTEEFAAILAHAAPHVQRALQLAYFTGTRPGKVELFRLQWKDVDLINKTITVTSAQKNGLPLRVVPIAESFYPIILQWRSADLEKGARYLVHYHGNRIDRMHSGWDNAKERAGITRRIRMYDIRHMSASVMLESGADLKAVSKILGHKNVMQTLTTYQHVSDDMKRSAVDKL
jgi:integrase